ncbi:hypothetical protein HanPI659440_Chr11g0408981 [Helianthus annuus]|nr:hypothetical protein HanPI659440_Chr11g0408981 [Helianthus annuus]
MLPFGSNSKPTTPLFAVFVCHTTCPSASARTRFPFVPNENVAFSRTGLPRLASQTQRIIFSDRTKPIRRARVYAFGVVL